MPRQALRWDVRLALQQQLDEAQVRAISEMWQEILDSKTRLATKEQAVHEEVQREGGGGAGGGCSGGRDKARETDGDKFKKAMTC